ncbi:MAG: carboxypeptidase-like regulatory domain-containing protein, partial [Bacteroidales bacterium]|nr:carboxypeptidase-like regulatory domain-containing protein [Bacteroidales bacterium]
MMFRMRYIFIVCLFALIPIVGYSQLTKIKGIAIDASTKQPIPFANIYFKNTTIGISAGFEGEFSLEVDTPADTLVASALGYHNAYVRIKKGVFQNVEFKLNPTEFSLNEVEIFAESDPMLILFNKMIGNKEKNNPEEFDFYEYRLYSKIEIDANNVNDKFKRSRMMKKFQVAFQYIDTSTINGKAYLPIFMSESVSHVYKKNKPKKAKEIIIASKISGINNESMSQYLGGLYQEINIYDNYISIFDKNFISPLANSGLTSYKYVLLDTVIVNNKNTYHVMFRPLRKQELTFVGELWIHDTTYAVIKTEMKVAVNANINFINDVAIGLEYDYVEGSHWVLSKDKIVLDLNVVENSMKVPGFFARRNSHYSNFVFNQAPPDSVFSQATDIIVLKGDRDKTDDYWVNNRDVPLNKNESGVYSMVDSVQNIPLFKTYIDAIYLFTGGHLNWGKFELGPVFKGLSYNATEGVRVRVGGRTNKQFSEHVRLHGYVAYGFGDEQIKGAGGMYYLLKKNPYRKVGIDFKYDLEQLGQRNVKFSNDNFLSSILSRSPNDKLSLVEGYKIYYDHEWFSGFKTVLSFNQRKMYPVGNLKFEVWDGENYSELASIKTSEISMKIRFAHREKYFVGAFDRITLGTKFPILEMNLTYG